jgi:hypothetical protein
MTTNGLYSALFQRKPPPPSCALLTAASPRAEPPAGAAVPLWAHQRAMLQRCLDIEETRLPLRIVPSNALRYMAPPVAQTSANLGVLNDPPGCGKTYVALALMALDATPTLNMVVVPPNLHHQWMQAVRAFFPDGSFRCESIKAYGDLHQWDLDVPRKPGVRLLLTSATLAERVRVKLHRVFIDEVDTATDYFHMLPACERVWFISASFDAAKHRRLGPFDLSSVSEADIGRVVCRCDLDFMAAQQPALLEPLTQVLELPDGEIAIFRGVLSDEAIVLLNAHNLATVKARVLRRNDASISSLGQLAQALLVDLGEERAGLKEQLARLRSEMSDTDASVCECMNVLQALEVRLMQLKLNMALVADERAVTKLDELQAWCDALAGASGVKWIVFSDDGALFDPAMAMLEARGVGYRSTAEGTTERNEASLRDYKTDPRVQVLFINSTRDGCGLNLEHTSHVLFVHYTNEHLVTQVIGRAQRPGRTEQLRVVCWYYANEVPANLRAGAA